MSRDSYKLYDALDHLVVRYNYYLGCLVWTKFVILAIVQLPHWLLDLLMWTNIVKLFIVVFCGYIINCLIFLLYPQGANT